MDAIKPVYRVKTENGKQSIIGTEETTGETAVILSGICSAGFAEETAKFLTENAVSIYHAKDVILDRAVLALERA